MPERLAHLCRWMSTKGSEAAPRQRAQHSGRGHVLRYLLDHAIGSTIRFDRQAGMMLGQALGPGIASGPLSDHSLFGAILVEVQRLLL